MAMAIIGTIVLLLLLHQQMHQQHPPTDATTMTTHPQVNDDDIDSRKELLIEFINSLILCAKKGDIKYSKDRQLQLEKWNL